MKQIEYLKEMRVLLAEDDDVFAKSLVNVLEIFVKEVIVAQNGQDAIDIYNNSSVDIVILDIDMPLMSGIEVAKEIRKSDTITPIIITTSFNDKEHLHKAISLMLIEYLIKPVQFDTVQKALNDCVEYLKKQGQLVIKIDEKTTYNKLNGELSIEGIETISLPAKEKKLLNILLENKNQLVKKEYLENEIFDLKCNETSLKNLVYRLKKRFHSELIINVKELGYIAVNHA